MQPLLRAVIATAGNDHRLGANEAPPAIISIFLGDQLTDVFEQIMAGGAKSSKAKTTLNIGVDTLPAAAPGILATVTVPARLPSPAISLNSRAVGSKSIHCHAAHGSEHHCGRIDRLYCDAAGS